MKYTLMFLCLTIGVFCSNGKLTKDKCSQMLSDAGASSKFAGSVAHAVHSMTVDDLKKFYPTANENNYVPTVNKDLKANKAILLYAPDVNMSNGTFITDGMKTLDIVLSRMDDKQWDIKNYSPLEKLVHAFHMKEVWAKALKQFDLIKSNPPNLETCYCALDIGHNGVMDVMKYLALVIREPSLVYGNPALKDFNWDGNVYRFNFLEQNSEKFVSNSAPRLTDAESWKIWKQMVSPDESFDAALFLYCAAKKANGFEQK